MLEEFTRRQQRIQMVRKKLQRKSNEVKQQSEKEETSEDLERKIDDLHTSIQQFVKVHEQGLEMLEEEFL